MNSRNKGSATVEATLVIPIFLFAILALYGMCKGRLAENVIYEAACETAEYVSEAAYLSGDVFYLGGMRFKEYVDDKAIVEAYVDGGVNGVKVFVSPSLDEDKNVVLTISYKKKSSVPIIGKLSKTKSYKVKQRAYIGELKEDKTEEDYADTYVYVTDNRDVYHVTRSCSHLRLTIYSMTKRQAANNGLTLCGHCNSYEGGIVYVAATGNVYHTDVNCSGLKRTVYRIKLKDAEKLGACLRCGGGLKYE